MNKIDMLFVRACKSSNAKRRVLSVYRRFYTRCSTREIEHAAAILLRVGNNAKPIPADKMLDMLKPDWFGAERSYWDRALDGLISWIALTERDHLTDVTFPHPFRNSHSSTARPVIDPATAH